MKALPKESLKLWKETAALPDKAVLRLAILRDLSRRLHAERSMHLAQGKIPQGQTLEQVEAQLAAMRGVPELIAGDDLTRALATKLSPEPARANLPEALAVIVPRAKLERYDRHWEAFIAAEAFARGWAIWELDATIQIAKAEAFHKHLSQLLWPKGVILYVESLPVQPAGSGEGSVWSGRWLLVSMVGLKPEHLEIERSPGIPIGSSISPPSWRRLFPQVKH